VPFALVGLADRHAETGGIARGRAGNVMRLLGYVLLCAVFVLWAGLCLMFPAQIAALGRGWKDRSAESLRRIPRADILVVRTIGVALLLAPLLGLVSH
jgi:hypothetical protein